MAAALHVDVPRPYEANPGIVAVSARRPVDRLEIRVDGRRFRIVDLKRPSKRVRVGPIGLPSRDLRLTVIGYADGKRVGAETVGNILGLPAKSTENVPIRVTAALAQRRLARQPKPPGSAASWTIDMATGRGASWNAGASFTGASTVKLGILATWLIRLHGDPTASPLWGTVQSMVRNSSNDAANAVLTAIGGSPQAGGPIVTATMRKLGATKYNAAGGYLAGQDRRAVPPVRVNDQPPLRCCMIVTAHDLGVIMQAIVQASDDAGRARRLGMTPRDARVALWLLTHTAYRGLFDPWTPFPTAHKIGYIDRVWHDVAAIFTPQGPLIAVALTENEGGASESAAAEYGRGVLQIARIGLSGPVATT